MKKLWVGLTGGIATGKTSVAKILRGAGFTVIDADQIAQDVVAPKTPGLKSVLSQFGSQFGSFDAGLDRKKIAAHVFSNPSNLEKLEKIIHPLVQQEVQHQRQQCLQRGESIIFYDVPLLFEKKLQSNFDYVVVVRAEQADQIKRLISGGKYTEAEVLQRIENQLPINEKAAKANFVLNNQGSPAELQAQVNKLIAQLELISKGEAQI